MRILIGLTYYRPHVSGLTIYSERLARGLTRRGHQVTVLTSRFHPRLPPRERMGGVEVIRVPVSTKLSKGVVMPLFPFYAWQQIGRHDVVNIHMPQLEAALLALFARLRRRPLVLTYQCDLRLPHGAFNRLVEAALVPLNHVAARLADRVTAMTADYAENSAYLRRYRDKITITPPLIDLPLPDETITERLRERHSLQGRTCIAFAARFAAEKGVEYLLEALPSIVERVPNACVIFTGAALDTVGEADYHARLRPLLDLHRDRLVFFDVLEAEEMASFFRLASVLAVTSLNSTESFAMVQAEAMLCGTPVVSTDLPGVREAVRRTGMGEIVPRRDPAALADALVRVLREPGRYRKPRPEIAAAFDLEAAIDAFDHLFAQLDRAQ